MRRPLTAFQKAGIIVVAVSLVVGVTVFSGHAERRMAEAAVRNVAGDAEIYWVVEASWQGRRRSLWCGGLRRPDGLVAVAIRNYRLPFLPQLDEVAPAWVEERTPYETQMLEACWRRVN